MSSKTYLHSINWFRGIAIIFVVITHVPVPKILEYSSGHYIQAYFQNGTSFFIFIAGYLYWHLIDRFNYINYLKTKFDNVLRPYLLLMTVTLITVFIINIGTIDESNLKYIVHLNNPLGESGFLWHLLKGGVINFPLWFIPMITVFFLFSSIIKKMGDSNYFNFYLIACLIITLITNRGDWAHLQFIHYLGVYLFGIFCKKNQEFIYDKSLMIALVSFPLSLVFVYFKVNVITLIPTGFPTDYFGYGFGRANYSEVQKLFSIVFFLALFMYLEKKELKFPVLDLLAKYSFGIFFVHYYFILICEFLFSAIDCDNTFVSIGGSLIIIIGMSLLVCHYIKVKLPLNSRYLLGI